MQQVRRRGAALAAVAVMTLAGAPAAHAAVRYRVVDLGTLPGGQISSAAAINDRGQVVGSSGLSGLGHDAFLWEDGVMRSLGQLDRSQRFSDANAIDSAGEIAGAALVKVAGDDTPHAHAFLVAHGRIRDLGLLAGGTTSEAYALNRYGLVAGEADLPGCCKGIRPVIWRHGRIRSLGTFGGIFGVARGVNRRGVVVGAAALEDGRVHAFRWAKGSKRDIGTLGGPSSEADAISRSGLIVGSSELRSGHVHAFAYIHRHMRDLGASARRPNSGALAVNRNGTAVGSIFRLVGGDPANEHAALFRRGAVRDLNALIPVASGWVLQQATGINSKGQIVGQGTIDDEQHAFLLVRRG
jgi:probable HAF family extracellular repeat protein